MKSLAQRRFFVILAYGGLLLSILLELGVMAQTLPQWIIGVSTGGVACFLAVMVYALNNSWKQHHLDERQLLLRHQAYSAGYWGFTFTAISFVVYHFVAQSVQLPILDLHNISQVSILLAVVTAMINLPYAWVTWVEPE